MHCTTDNVLRFIDNKMISLYLVPWYETNVCLFFIHGVYGGFGARGFQVPLLFCEKTNFKNIRNNPYSTKHQKQQKKVIYM